MKKAFSDLIDGAVSVGFLGLGRSNLSLLRMVPDGISVTLRSDSKIDGAALPRDIRVSRIFEGEAAMRDIDEQILFLSPSVRRDRPELVSAVERGARISSDAELFFKEAKAPVLAVSGSSGKSTTAALTALLINGDADGESSTANNGFSEGSSRAEQRRDSARVSLPAVLCGNIGKPMLEATDPRAELYVAELSSFMLMSHRATVKRSAITNITQNHLDWHVSFDEYRDAKLSLLSLSEEIIISADDRELSSYVGRARRIFGVFSTELRLTELLMRHKARIYMTLEDGYICRNGERIIDTGRLIRREKHNIANMMCAILLSDGYAKKEMLADLLYRFSGLPHRCETVAGAGGVDYINSSIDTTPERCAATLLGLGRRVILLLGGRGKGLSYEALLRPVSEYARLVFTFGEEGARLADELSSVADCKFCGGFREAVISACLAAREGEAVLLSPACTSFDEFCSFEERGKVFSELASKCAGGIGRSSDGGIGPGRVG